MNLPEETTVMYNMCVIKYEQPVYIATIRIDIVDKKVDPNNSSSCSNTTRKATNPNSSSSGKRSRSFMWAEWNLGKVGSFTCMVLLQYDNNGEVVVCIPLSFHNVDVFKFDSKNNFFRSFFSVGNHTFLKHHDIRLTCIRDVYLLYSFDLQFIMFFDVNLTKRTVDLTHLFRINNDVKGMVGGQNLCVLDFQKTRGNGDDNFIFRAMDHYYHGRNCIHQEEFVSYLSIFCKRDKLTSYDNDNYNNGGNVTGYNVLTYEGRIKPCCRLSDSSIDGLGCTNLNLSKSFYVNDKPHENVDESCHIPILSNGTSPIIIETNDEIIHLMVGHSKIHSDTKNYLYDMDSKLGSFRNFVHIFMNVTDNYIPHLGSHPPNRLGKSTRYADDDVILCKGYIYCMYFCVVRYDKENYQTHFDREIKDWAEFYKTKSLKTVVDQNIAKSVHISDSYLPLNLSRYNNNDDKKIFSLFFPMGLTIGPTPDKLLISGGEGDYYVTQIICETDKAIASCKHGVVDLNWEDYNYKVIYNQRDLEEIDVKGYSNIFTGHTKLVNYIRDYPRALDVSMVLLEKLLSLCYPEFKNEDMDPCMFGNCKYATDRKTIAKCLANSNIQSKLDEIGGPIYQENRNEMNKFLINYFDSLVIFVKI